GVDQVPNPVRARSADRRRGRRAGLRRERLVRRAHRRRDAARDREPPEYRDGEDPHLRGGEGALRQARRRRGRRVARAVRLVPEGRGRPLGESDPRSGHQGRLKILGIIGGIAPASTIEYYRLLVERWRQRMPGYPP